MGPNFFEEAGFPEGPPPAIPGDQPTTPAIPADLAPPPPAAPAVPGGPHVPTWADTLAELPEFYEEPSFPAPAPAAAAPPPAAQPAAQPPPQAPAFDASAIGREVVNGLLGAARAQQQEQRFNQEAGAALAMPQLDRERALVDGEYLESYFRAYGDAVARRTLAQVAPAFNQAAAMAEIGPTVIQANINLAQSEGARRAKDQLGMSQERFDELVPEVHRMIAENPDGRARLRFLTSPQAWVMGVDVAHRNGLGGVPVQRSAPPPAVGGGGAPAAAGSPGAMRGKTPMMALVEKQLGRPGLFKPEHVERVKEMAAMGGTREARRA